MENYGPRKCINCGNLFDPKNSRHSCCMPKCRREYEKKRKETEQEKYGRFGENIEDLKVILGIKERNRELVFLWKTVFMGLTLKELMVLISKNGTLDKTPKTLTDVGNIMGISKERVRQLYNQAMIKVT